jgi:serine protease DegQ
MRSLESISQDLRQLAAAGGLHVVRIEGRRGTVTNGVVWSDDGTIVAAEHAVDEEEGLEVGLPGGDVVEAERLGSDPTTDLAVLKVKGVAVSAPTWAEPDGIGVGELILGLSRPGRSLRVELGVIQRAAGEWRAPAGGRLDRYVESSLAIRPGLSGTLVIGADGSALGMATAGLARGASLVVPAPTLRRVVEAIRRHGSVRRGYLGVATLPVRLPPAAAERAGQETALLVSGVEPGGPADAGGILLGDALLALGGAPVRSLHDLAPALEPERIGGELPARILRGGAVQEVKVTIGARGTGGAR